MHRSYWLSRLFIALLVSWMSIGIAEIGRAQSDNERRLYDNEELFQQLSGAKRTLLEFKFGKKHLPGEETGVTSSDVNTGLRQEKKVEVQNQVTITPRDGSFHTQTGTPYSLDNNVDVLTNNNTGNNGTAHFTQSQACVLAFGSRVVVAFNDAGSYEGGTSKFTGYAYSSDGGVTFTDGGTLPTSAGGDAGDPVLARNETTGRIYLATMGFNVSTIQVFRSDDNGVTWMAPVNGTPAGSSQSDEWIAVDNFSGVGNGNVYLISRGFNAGGDGIHMYRSVDNGATFVHLGLIVSGNQGAFVAVGPDHAVYAFWYAGTTLQMRKSTDLGVNFGAAVTVTSGLAAPGVNGDLGLTGLRQGLTTFASFRTNSFPHAAVNPVSGNVYVTYNDNPVGADKGDVFFVQSTTGGATWTAPVRVNDDITTTDQWQPTMAVTPDGLALGIFYYSRQEDPVDNNLFRYYGRTGTINGSSVTFSASLPISDVASLPEFGRDGVLNSLYMGDYNSATVTASNFHTVWSDNRDDLAGGAPRKDPNVYYESIPATLPPVLLSFDSQVMSDGDGDGIVEPNECSNLNVTVKNNGTATAASISGTLATSTPGVTVIVSTSPYSNVASGAAGTNTIPFRIQTLPSYVCGTPVALTLTLTYTGGSDVITPSALPSAVSGYVITSTTGASIVPGTTDIGNHGDDAVTAIDLPFAYSFYGTTFTTANVTSNGNLQFSSSNSEFTNVCMPTSTLINLISPHWDDQRTDLTFPGKGIFTSTSGASPNRIFNIEWRTVYLNNTTQNANFEIRLYEGQQKFDFVYSTMDQTGSGATVGCQQGPGPNNTQYECNTGGLSSGLLLTFTFFPCVDAGGSGCVPLPIQLASFTGTVVNHNQVRLDWMTLSEINNYGFEVQKSVEPNGNFQTIPGSFIPGHGTTNEPQYYTYTDTPASAATLYYRLKQIDLDGTIHYIDPIRIDLLTSVSQKGVPTEFSLEQNHPNPFNPSTTIQYQLPQAAHVTLKIYDALGQEVATLVDGEEAPGYKTAVWNAANIASGVYFCRIVMTSGQPTFVDMRKMLVMK